MLLSYIYARAATKSVVSQYDTSSAWVTESMLIGAVMIATGLRGRSEEVHDSFFARPVQLEVLHIDARRSITASLSRCRLRGKAWFSTRPRQGFQGTCLSWPRVQQCDQGRQERIACSKHLQQTTREGRTKARDALISLLGDNCNVSTAKYQPLFFRASFSLASEATWTK